MELRVLGLIDHTHSPAAKLFQDAVVRDCLSDHEGGPTVLANLRAEPETSQCAAGAGSCFGRLIPTSSRALGKDGVLPARCSWSGGILFSHSKKVLEIGLN